MARAMQDIEEAHNTKAQVMSTRSPFALVPLLNTATNIVGLFVCVALFPVTIVGKALAIGLGDCWSIIKTGWIQGQQL